MIKYVWPGIVLGALLLVNMGCSNRSAETTPTGNTTTVGGVNTSANTAKHGQSLHGVGTSAIDGKNLQQLVAAYDENFTHLTKRIQASTEDKWYISAHKYNTDVQINFDLQAVQSDVETIAKIEMPVSSSSARLRDLRTGLQHNTDNLSAAVQDYLAPNNPTAHDASLKAVRQSLELNQKQFLAFKKLLNTPATTSAKI